MAEEVGPARIWAGIHYRFSTDAGLAGGIRVADCVLESFAKPPHGSR